MVYARKAIKWEETKDALLERLRDFLIAKGQRIGRVLSAYDRDGSGLIHDTEFVSALRRLGFPLSDRDIALLREGYEDGRTAHFIQWKELAGDVDVGPEPADSPDLSTKSDPVIRSRERHPTSPQLIPLFGRIYRALRKCGVNVQDELLKLDRLKRGTAPISGFRQIVSLLPLKLLPSEIDSIVDCYRDVETSRIDYPSFYQDLQEFGSTAPPIPPKPRPVEEEVVTPPVVLRVEQDQTPVQPILLRFKQYSHRTRQPLREVFQDFDRFKNGTVPISKLATALSATGLSFSRADIDLMCRFFGDPKRPDCLNYMALCQAVASVEDGASGLGIVPLTGAEEAALVQLIRRWTDFLMKRRWTFRRLFSGSPDGLMSIADFQKKIVATGVFLKPDEWRLVTWKYKGNPEGEIDWQRFVSDTEKDRILLL
jgi:Ca2+-binding EF-hand superfamily protein